MKNRSIPFQFLFLFISILSFGQTEEKQEKLYRIKTAENNIFIGQLLYENDSTLSIQVESIGEIKIDQKNIVSVKELKRKFKSKTYSQDYASGYFIATTGYSLNEGEKYYQNFWIFCNQVSFGITKNFSLGAGILPQFMFHGDPTPIWISPKVSIPVIENKYNIGIGGLFGTTIGDDSNYGILYLTNTLGSRQNNVSLGVNWGYIEDEFADYPFFNIGFQIKVRPKAYLIGESYFSPADGDLAFISLGGRSKVGKVFIDYGVFTPTGMGEAILIPILGVKIPL